MDADYHIDGFSCSDGNSESDGVVLGHDDVSNYNREQILPLGLDVIEKIRNWLQPTSYDHSSSEYRKHLASREQGTCSWLTATPAYQSWLNGSENGMIWVQGIPGSGKSVLAANLVHDISVANPGVPVLYFFFRQIIDANHSPSALLRDWLDQVLIYSPPLQHRLKEHVDKNTPLTTIGMPDLWKLLRLALGELRGTSYLIADALDEMDKGNSSFLQDLAALGSFYPEKIRLLVTSRPLPEIASLWRLTPHTQIRLEEAMVDLDISLFVRNRLAGSSLSAEDQDLVHAAVPGRANGLFLYAKLALDAFLEPGASVQKILAKLPDNLSDIYTDLLWEHARRSGVPLSIQRPILEAVTHSIRPLRLLEMADMIRSVSGADALADIKSSKDKVRASCGPLLEILPDETVSVVHHSFTEYLTGQTRSSETLGVPVLDFSETNAKLGRVCVAYLRKVLKELERFYLHDKNDGHVGNKKTGRVNIDLVQIRLKYPFFDYAKTYWNSHINRCELHDQKRLNDSVHELFHQPLFRDVIMNGVNTVPLTFGFGASFQTKFDYIGCELYVAASLGLAAYCQRLLSVEGLPVEGDGKDTTTPLGIAAEKGHAECVSVLISAGAGVHKEEIPYGTTPLKRAAASNRAKAAKVLLEAGADPMSPFNTANYGKRSGPSFHVVCQSGHLETLEVFLPFIQNPKHLYEGLQHAVCSSRERLVAALLQHPQMNIHQRHRGMSVLCRACKLGRLDMVKMLLEAGADPNESCPLPARTQLSPISPAECTPLYCLFTRDGHFDDDDDENQPNDDGDRILDLLMEHGADLSKTSWAGKSPIHLSIDSPALISRLLSLGLDANAVDQHGGAPLHYAADGDSVAILVESGSADVEQRDESDGRTPLLAALDDSRREAAGKLLEYGADCQAVDSEGNGPLHLTFRRGLGDMALINRLLSQGADPNLKNAHGETPLILLNPENDHYMGILDLFLEKGWDINSKDKDGKTALFHLAVDREILDAQRIQSMLDRGASIDTRDAKGRTLLHEMTSPLSMIPDFGTEAHLFRFFLALGLDPRAVDNDGNTLLHMLCLPRNSGPDPQGLRAAAWSFLIDLGLDANARNSDGRTPLHLLAEMPKLPGLGGRAAQFELQVVSAFSDLNIQDDNGIAPIHIAVTVGRPNVITKMLVDRGADPGIQTSQGLTPLHLAVRVGDADTVGLLLDALAESEIRGSWYRDGLLGPVPGVDARDQRGWTPLSYACRSGRVDLVDMFIKAGADATDTVHLEACSQFDQELTLWAKCSSGNYAASACLRIEDESRPSCYSCGSGVTDTLCYHALSSLGLILTRLLHAGSQSSSATGNEGQRKALFALVSGIDASKKINYTEACLQEAFIAAVSKTPMPEVAVVKLQHIRDTNAMYHEEIRSELFSHTDDEGSENVAQDMGYDWEAELARDSLFRRIMRKRAYRLLPALRYTDLDFFQPSDGKRKGKCWRAELDVRDLLYTLLVQNLPCQESEAKSKSLDEPVHPKRLAYVLARDCTLIVDPMDSPNLTVPVLRVLVEKYDFNIMEANNGRRDGGVPMLYRLAQGKTWRQVSLAMPLLIELGVDVDQTAPNRETPLYRTVKLNSGMYADDAACLLIRSGADLAADPSPLLAAVVERRNDLVQRMLEAGAKLRPDAMWMAIQRQRPDILEVVSEACPPDFVNSVGCPGNGECLFWYPLHYAAAAMPPRTDRDEWRDNMHQIIRLLLRMGADPFAAYSENEESTNPRNAMRWAPGRLQRPGASPPTQGTIFHELLACGSSLIEPLLDIPNLDVNRRDARERTPLHMACIVNPDLAFSSASPEVSKIQALLSLGADPHAIDDQGRNALHYLFYTTKQVFKNPDGFSNEDEMNLRSIELLARQYPKLINQPGKRGRTPLNSALRRAAANFSCTKAIRLLLSLGADPCAEDDDGNTVLHCAAQGADDPEVLDILKYLLREHPQHARLDINAKNKSGETPLWSFASAGLSRRRPPYSVHMRRKEEEKIGGQGGAPGCSFLYDEAEREDLDSIKTVLDTFQALGADFYTVDSYGKGLLHAAASVKDFYREVRFKMLWERGLDPFLEDHEQRTALDIADSVENDAIMSWFQKR